MESQGKRKVKTNQCPLHFHARPACKHTRKKDRKTGVERGIAPERLPGGEFAKGESDK